MSLNTDNCLNDLQEMLKILEKVSEEGRLSYVNYREKVRVAVLKLKDIVDELLENGHEGENIKK